MDVEKHSKIFFKGIFLLTPENIKCVWIDISRKFCVAMQFKSHPACAVYGKIVIVTYVVLNCHASVAKFLNISSFQVGDLVLIILDERHDNYVLFTVSPTLYFLHSESLAALDLKPGECGKCQIIFNICLPTNNA